MWETSLPYRPHNELSPPHITLCKISTADAQGLSTVELVFILNQVHEPGFCFWLHPTCAATLLSQPQLQYQPFEKLQFTCFWNLQKWFHFSVIAGWADSDCSNFYEPGEQSRWYCNHGGGLEIVVRSHTVVSTEPSWSYRHGGPGALASFSFVSKALIHQLVVYKAMCQNRSI